MLAIEPRMVKQLLSMQSKLFQIHVFWCPFLDPHLTTHHSSIGDRSRYETDSGVFTPTHFGAGCHVAKTVSGFTKF